MAAVLDELMERANLASAQGRFDDCAALCGEILAALPDSVPALVLAGVALSKMGDPPASIEFFQRAIAIDPRGAPAHLWLSMALRDTGNKLEALSHAQRATTLNPGDPIGIHHLGQCLMDLERFEAALGSLERAAIMAPNVALPQFTLGIAFKALKRNPEATSALRRSVRLNPSSVSALVALRGLLMEEGDTVGAAQVARDVLALEPQSAEATVWLALALLECGKAAEADAYAQQAIDLEPNSAMAYSLLGSIFQIKGDLTVAETHYRRSMELQPKQGSAYLGFARNRKMNDADRPLVDNMQALADDNELSPFDRSQINYALGKGFEDLGDYEQAMRHLDEANRLAFAHKFGNSQDDTWSLESYHRLAQMMTPDFFERHRSGGSASKMPILVVGMIRSGTTLAEQILSSHPSVGAAGEQRFWLESGLSVLTAAGSRVDMPMLGRLAGRYEKLLREIAPGKAHVVDKMPMNYIMLGMIHLAFPGTKIIHMRRHPVDTSLSIYATPNRIRLGWAHDKGNIVLAYREYERLMQRWRDVLPPGTILEVQYEDLVRDPEPATRELIEFCGLEWNDACLRPEENERTVVTPSVWQVRQPVYRTSVARWKKFEPWLGPLAELMPQSGV